MPICHKCHLKTHGHNQLNCGMEQCNSSTLCGKLAKHPDEKLSLKNLEKEEASIMKEIDEAERDLKRKEVAFHSIKIDLLIRYDGG